VETDLSLQYSKFDRTMTGFFISLCTLRDLLKEKNSRALCKGEILPFLYERTNQKTWPELPNSFTKPACWFFHGFLKPRRL
jgi:hypothetical protein